jgi:hypothetical protein
MAKAASVDRGRPVVESIITREGTCVTFNRDIIVGEDGKIAKPVPWQNKVSASASSFRERRRIDFWTLVDERKAFQNGR